MEQRTLLTHFLQFCPCLQLCLLKTRLACQQQLEQMEHATHQMNAQSLEELLLEPVLVVLEFAAYVK